MFQTSFGANVLHSVSGCHVRATLTRIGLPQSLRISKLPSPLCARSSRVMHAGAMPPAANAGELTPIVTPTAMAMARTVVATVRMDSFHMTCGTSWVREGATGDDPTGSQDHAGSVATSNRQHTTRHGALRRP